jgi:hypothetical protein
VSKVPKGRPTPFRPFNPAQLQAERRAAHAEHKPAEGDNASGDPDGSPADVGHASTRTTAMKQVEAELGKDAAAAMAQAQQAIETLKREGSAAGAASVDAGVHALDALERSLSAAGHAMKGAAIAAGGVAVRIAEELGDLIGAALQFMGRGLLAVGNFLREIGGGAQVTTDTVQGEDKASLSDRLFNKSAAEFQRASAAASAAIDALVAGGGDLKRAAHHLVATAEASLEAAVALGEAGVIKVAESAVAAARKAVELAERGVDTAGAALQKAGTAMIEAGNAVNTARGTDTAIDAA